LQRANTQKTVHRYRTIEPREDTELPRVAFPSADRTDIADIVNMKALKFVGGVEDRLKTSRTTRGGSR
jgi:hypothetical protein